MCSSDSSSTDIDFAGEPMFSPMGPVEVPYLFYDEEFDRQYVLTLCYPVGDPLDFPVEEFNVKVEEAYAFDESGEQCQIWDFKRHQVEARFFEHHLGSSPAVWGSLRDKVSTFLEDWQ